MRSPITLLCALATLVPFVAGSVAYPRDDASKPHPTYRLGGRDDASKPHPTYRLGRRDDASKPHPTYRLGRRDDASKPHPTYYLGRRDDASKPHPTHLLGRRDFEQIAMSPTTPTEKIDVSAHLCPDGLHACPISRSGSTPTVPATLGEWLAKGYECVDTVEDLTSCGGCASLEPGLDCTAIPNALAVSCAASKCQIHSCKLGYERAEDGETCVRAARVSRK